MIGNKKVYECDFTKITQAALTIQLGSGHFKGFPISRSIGLLFLEIFGILEGKFSYFVEFIYRTYEMICTSYSTYRTVNFQNLISSKKNYLLQRIFPHLPLFANIVQLLSFGFIWYASARIQNGGPGSENADHPTVKSGLISL